MDEVESSRIIRMTLEEISRRHGIELETFREAHQPILQALQEEESEKLCEAEARGFERGRIESEVRHWFISGLGFGRIGKGEDAMDKGAVHSIIDSTIRLGGKSPGTLSHKKINALQSELESCTSILEVFVILENNRGLICKSFGVGGDSFDECLENIKSLELQSSENISCIHEDRIAAARSAERTVSSLVLIAKNGVAI